MVPIQKLDAADGNPVRLKLNEIIDILNGNPEPPIRPDWSNDAPVAPGKWKRHATSEKLMLDRENMTQVIAHLTDQQREEIVEDLGEVPTQEVTES